MLREAVDVLGEQAAQMIERMRFGVVKSGTNVVFSNGSARNAVNTPVGITTQRRAIRSLKRQNARPITHHRALDRLLRHRADQPGLRRPVSPRPRGRYPQSARLRSGGKSTVRSARGKTSSASADVRHLTSTIFDPWADAGGAKAGTKRTCLSTTGTSADVYPLLYVGSDAYGIVALKAPMPSPDRHRPKPSDSDPLQRGHAGWKSICRPP